jgi:hypothetical protein
VLLNGQEIPSQKEENKLYCIADLQPAETKKLVIRTTDTFPQYEQRAHAELSKKVGGYFKDHIYIGGEFESVTFEKVPPEHRDHSTYYRFEGPGWESDLVGYRLYLDQRNRIDIFGKKVNRIVLPQVGLDGFDSYHEMSDWGADIFKVGESIGIGSLGIYFNGSIRYIDNTDSTLVRIVADGPILAEIQLDYYGWEIDGKKVSVQSNLSIHAGSRLTKYNVIVSNGLSNLVTGLAKNEECKSYIGDINEQLEWNYMALWGKQSLLGGNLGTVIFFRNIDLIEISEDDLNHFLILEPTDGTLTYYFAAAWEYEPNGIKTENEFVDYLNQTVYKLNNPVEVIYDKN